jgi:hypothetical protein
MGVERKKSDPALKATMASAAAPTPPLLTRRATPPQVAVVRPPPPPRRVKRTDGVDSGGGQAPTAPARSLSPSPADMAFTRTLRLMIRRDIEEAQRMVRRRDFVRAERLFRRVTVFDAGHAEANAGLTMCLAKLHNAK